MEEDAFKRTHRKVNDNPCPFGKSLQRNCGACTRAEKLLIAEREMMGCISPGARARCKAVLDTLREKALFALHLTQADAPLAYGKEMKVQCGGLFGLRQALHPHEGETSPITDVYELIDEAERRFEGIDNLPFGQIAQHISRYQARSRRDGQ